MKKLFWREKPRDQPHDHGQSSPPLSPAASAPSPYPVAPEKQKLGGGFWGRGDKEREKAEMEAREREREYQQAQQNRGRERREEENELTRKIGFLAATAFEDWTLVLDVCDHASATEANAKEAVRALRREFKYGEPAAQLAAARLWAIMLRNCSETFISQCTSRKFLGAVEDLLTSSRTAPVVRERVMDVLAAAAYASEPKKNIGFRGLWRRVKPSDKPEEGVPFDSEDAMFKPLIDASQRANAVLDHDSNTTTANATRYDYAARANTRYDSNATLPPPRPLPRPPPFDTDDAMFGPPLRGASQPANLVLDYDSDTVTVNATCYDSNAPPIVKSWYVTNATSTDILPVAGNPGPGWSDLERGERGERWDGDRGERNERDQEERDQARTRKMTLDSIDGNANGNGNGSDHSPLADTPSGSSISSSSLNMPQTGSVESLLNEQKLSVASHALVAEESAKESLVDTFLDSKEKRATLLAQGLSAGVLRDALRLCEQQICTSLLAVLGSHDAKCEVLLLQSTRAQSFLDAVQAVLDRGSLPSAADTSRARRLIIRLSEARDQLPSSLFITGVTDHDEHPNFSGGFGDIYRASYNGTMVALKRVRMFQAGADSPRNRLQFCRETLVWQTLRHQYVLPLIGIDRDTFPSFCLVSPWMQHGTILRYLSEHGRADVDEMLLQIAEGLAYLHSMKIVHGDLRGTNILVSDDWNACLADFGLTGVIEDAASTTGGALTSTANHAGSVRWFAPELIAPTTFGCERFMRTTASDVYAFACVCLELYTGRPPFFEVSPEIAAMLKVIAGERPSRPESMSDDLWDLITAAWAQNFRERPGTEKIIESLTTLLNPKDLQEKDQHASDD